MSLFSPVGMPQQNMYPQGNTSLQMPFIPSGNEMPNQSSPADMSVMNPTEPSAGAEMPAMNGVPNVNSASPATPTYVGNPMLDKYIHMFIGGV